MSSAFNISGSSEWCCVLSAGAIGFAPLTVFFPVSLLASLPASHAVSCVFCAKSLLATLYAVHNIPAQLISLFCGGQTSIAVTGTVHVLLKSMKNKFRTIKKIESRAFLH